MTNEVQNPLAQTAYEVGYGKPPKQTQWKPGQSGNPTGKSGAPSLRAIFLKAANKRVKPSEPEGPYNPTIIEEVMRNILSQATLGNRFAHMRVLDMCREFFAEEDDGAEPEKRE